MPGWGARVDGWIGLVVFKELLKVDACLGEPWVDCQDFLEVVSCFAVSA